MYHFLHDSKSSVLSECLKVCVKRLVNPGKGREQFSIFAHHKTEMNLLLAPARWRIYFTYPVDQRFIFLLPYSKNSIPQAVPVNLSEIKAKAPEMMGKLISLDGMVAHICRESGKRLFLGEESFKVLATNNVPTFKIELEGSDVTITGYLKEDRIDETYLANWGKRIERRCHCCSKGRDPYLRCRIKKDLTNPPWPLNLNRFKGYREQIAADGKGYISFTLLKQRVSPRKNNEWNLESWIPSCTGTWVTCFSECALFMRSPVLHWNHLRDWNPNYVIKKYDITLNEKISRDGINKEWVISLLDDSIWKRNTKSTISLQTIPSRFFWITVMWKSNLETGNGVMENHQKAAGI